MMWLLGFIGTLIGATLFLLLVSGALDRLEQSRWVRWRAYALATILLSVGVLLLAWATSPSSSFHPSAPRPVLWV